MKKSWLIFRSAWIPLQKKHVEHKKRCARAQSYANAIWSRWLRDYVPLLNKRVKLNTQSGFTLKTCDLVWVIEPDSPSGYHPLARIVTLHYGWDSSAPSALVKISTRDLTRPTVKLAPFFLQWRRMLLGKYKLEYKYMKHKNYFN